LRCAGAGHGGEARLPLQALLHQFIDPLVACQGDDLESIGVAGNDVQRVAAHRTGGAKDAQALSHRDHCFV
jgi:hypothetical protein